MNYILVQYLSVLCFNRYMVECELELTNVIGLVYDRFNRYMVECELWNRS